MLQQTIKLYKNAYSGLTRDTWYLSAVMLVNRSGTMVVPFLTIYLTQSRHFTIGQAGLVMSCFGAGSIVGALIGGRLTDRIGFHIVQLSALIGGGLMFILLGQLQHYLAICICTFLLSLVNESFRPANSAAIAFYSKPENRTRSYSVHRLAINLGWAVGGALGGIIASFNYQLLFWVDGLTNIMAALLLWRMLKPRTTSEDAHTHKQSESKGSAFRDRPYLVFILLTAVFATCFFQNFSMVPVFLKEQLRLGEFYIGLVLGLNGLIIACFEMIMIYRVDGKMSPLSFIVLGVLCTGGAFVLLNILPLPALLLAVVSIILLTIGEMLAMPFMNAFWVGRSNASNRGQYASLYTIAYSTAQVVGPTIGAQVVRLQGFTFLWYGVGVVALLNALGFRWLKQRLEQTTGKRVVIAPQPAVSENQMADLIEP
jgi:predicted MFS family arabinose efflux permease